MIFICFFGKWKSVLLYFNFFKFHYLTFGHPLWKLRKSLLPQNNGKCRKNEWKWSCSGWNFMFENIIENLAQAFNHRNFFVKCQMRSEREKKNRFVFIVFKLVELYPYFNFSAHFEPWKNNENFFKKIRYRPFDV